MVTLTDAQQDAIFQVARPLKPHERAAFMAALCELIVGCRRSLGDGELMRELRALQRRYFQPPTDTDVNLFGARR
jgi:hypothetical protein